MCALNFLRAKGFSEEAIFADMSRDGLGPNRDEFGLPCRSGASGDNVVGNPLTDKMKSVLGASTDAEVVGDLPTMGAEEVLDDLSKPAVDPGEQNDKKRKTWVDVVKPEISPSLSLDYIPRKPATVVNDELGDGVPEVSKTASKEVKASTSVEGSISPLVEASDSGWQDVPKKFTARCPLSSPGSDVSPSPCNTFKNLTMVDEIDAKRATVEPSGAVLSRSQRKKQRRALKVQGASPSSQS
ncbi:hypothetical protein ACET3Z_021319 [Daucus carota]